MLAEFTKTHFSDLDDLNGRIDCKIDVWDGYEVGKRREQIQRDLATTE